MSANVQKSTEGKDLGDYVVIKKKLGSGSYADVYQGYKKSDKSTVAIKVVSKSKMNQKLNNYLELEIQTLKKLNHSSIIKLFEVQRSAKHIYLIMEYCAGGNLSEYIRQVTKGPLPEKMVSLFMYEITKGLKHLDQQNLIHRDLKPQNILLTNLDDPHIKIADFGFARYLLENDLAETQCGSPLYMAPEVLKGEKYNSKADLWSLAAILYECFVGKPPFNALSVIQLIKIIKTTQIDYSKVPSESAIDLMKKLFVLDPDDRLSFEEFFSHPYIRSIFKEREPKKHTERKISSPISPRRFPKTSPFKIEELNAPPEEVENVEDFDSVGDFLIIEPKKQPLTNLLKTSESGYVIYSTIIFDFSNSKFDEKNEEQMKIINQIENIAHQSWSIAELALILERSSSDKSEPLSLYIKSLFHLYDLVRYIKQSVPQELLCERILHLMQWSESCYHEFSEYASNLSQNLPTNSSIEISPEELMYKYAIKTAKEAAFTEYLQDNPDVDVLINSLNMYKRCVYIFDYLISNKKFEDQDKKWFKSLLSLIKSRVEKFPSVKKE